MTDAAFNSAVREVTPGERAHRRWLEARWPDMTPQAIAKDWEVASDRAKAAWAAVAGQPGPELAGLRRLLGEIGALAASANGGGEPYWRVVEEIAMRVAAAGIPDGPQSDAGGTGLNDGKRAAWSDAHPPGGMTCAVPDPSAADGLCGYPVESEPCPVHGDPQWRPE